MMSAAPIRSDEQERKLYRSLLAEMDTRYQSSNRDWLLEQVWTIDEASQQELRWPADKIYLLELMDAFERYECLAIPKSRRMMVTWAVAAWAVWRARYHRNNAIFVQSENEDKAAYVIDKRCAWIEDHLEDSDLRRPYKALHTSKGAIGRMAYEGTGSYIWGIPQGGDVIRTYTFTALVMDEVEFQPEGHEALTAALAAVEKGAKLVLISSSNGPRGVLAEICREIGFTRFA
jgi:phage FluMu gp28-like protein